MTRMTGPDCVVMCNLINTHTHTPVTSVLYLQSQHVGTQYPYSYTYKTNANRSAEVGGDGEETGKVRPANRRAGSHEAHQRYQIGGSFLQKLGAAFATGEHRILWR